MRLEFVINEGWRQIGECSTGCGYLYVYKVKQAKRISLKGDYLCADCYNEVLNTRYLIEAMMKKQLEII